MFAQHPLLGTGPDNFRHVYGQYLGLPAWDERVHANNLYLELLADVGILGTAAFGLVIAPAVVGLVRAVRDSPQGIHGVWLAGLGASMLAFFVHGTLDYFLDFTPVYVLFWLIVGLTTTLSGELDTCQVG
jgi:O-antigen ligase